MDLGIRILSAIVLSLITASALYLGGYFLFAFAIIVTFLMMFDVTNAFSKAGYKINKIILFSVVALLGPAIYFCGFPGYLILLLVVFSVLASYIIFNKNHDFKSLIISCFLLVYPLLPGAILIFLSVYDIKNNARLGTAVIIGAVLCACLADAIAYFGGRLFGKKKLCPSISPKKTVAGSIASFFGGTLGGLIMFLLFNDIINIGIIFWIIIGFLCGGLAQIGDLCASMLKRFCNIKDYGKYIPGHGGIMDRMDSISTCLFAFVVIIQLFFVNLF